jgi:phenylacetate-CoA ligase
MNLPSQLYRLGRSAYRNLTLKPPRQRELFYNEILQSYGEQSQAYLQSLLDYATVRVPYYTNLADSWREGNSELTHFPLLTKPLIRENFERLKSDEIASRNCFLNSSGGSTGQPISIMQDREFEEWREATELFYYRQFLGIDLGGLPQVILWGSTKDIKRQTNTKDIKGKLLKLIQPTTFLNSFKMTKEDLQQYVEIINQERPVLIKAYAGSLYQLAKFVKNNNLSIHRPKLLYTSAETLRPFMRELIEDVFGCKVYDFYGSREVGAIAGECSRGKIHIFNFNNYLEVVDRDNNPVQLGEEGRILVTTLHNYSMPLIRYEIGDMAIPGKPCDCGSSLPTLARVTGRVKDHFLTKEGTMVDGGYFTRQFYFRNWVDEFQVLQKDFDFIEIYYVSNGEPVASEMADICTQIRLAMGEDCQIEWHQVEEVPRTPQGKLLYTRSLVNL